MAYPTLQLCKIIIRLRRNYIPTNKTQNSFVRITADTTSGSPIITNIVENAGGSFTTSELKVGMILVSGGEFSGDVTITALDLGSSQLTVSANATATATSQTMRVRPPKGMYFFESASFSKVGSGEPSDLRDITGSEDADYLALRIKMGYSSGIS